MLERYTTTGEEPQQQNVTTYNRDGNTLYAAKLVVSRPLWQGNLSFGGEYTYTDHETVYRNEQGILDDDQSEIGLLGVQPRVRSCTSPSRCALRAHWI